VRAMVYVGEEHTRPLGTRVLNSQCAFTASVGQSRRVVSRIPIEGEMMPSLGLWGICSISLHNVKAVASTVDG
jgi:hypothetical protein